jgi:hypothetical protein
LASSLDVCFLAVGSVCGPQDHCLRTSLLFPVTGKNAHPARGAASGSRPPGNLAGYGIWYARDGIVKAGHCGGNAENTGNLTFWHLVCQK